MSTKTVQRLRWWQAYPGWRPRTHGACAARCGWQFMSDTDVVVRAQWPDGTFVLYCETCASKHVQRDKGAA